MNLNEVVTEKERLESDAKRIWEEFASDLEKRIPESCAKWAFEKGYVKTLVNGSVVYWTLLEWLGYLVDNTRMGFCNSDKYKIDELCDYGFRSFSDLKRKFAELQEAWKDVVRIRIGRIEGNYKVEVFYYAVGFEPTKK